MYSKFNYCPSKSFYHAEINQHLTSGKALFNSHTEEVQRCLSEYITEDGIINGSELRENWFSISHKDIFISHSHQDLNKVQAFAGWLYDNFGLQSFIDSCSWGYCDKLLRKIDDKYCYNAKSHTYDYDLRNYTTSHVHMMLATALTEMMDKTECIIFFNTPNSIKMADELDNIKNNRQTLSPWIYYELTMTSMLRNQERPIRKNKVQFNSQAQNSLQIQYDVEAALRNMVNLSDTCLVRWKEMWQSGSRMSGENALDKLYEIIFPKI